MTLLLTGMLAIAASQNAPADQVYVRFMDLRTGAAVLVRDTVPPAEAAALVDSVSAGQAPAGVVRSWAAGAGVSPPVRVAAPVTREYVDLRWGTTVTTGCGMPLDRVVSMLNERDPRAAIALLGRAGADDVLGVQRRYEAGGRSYEVIAMRGRLEAAPPPARMIVTASDMRTGRTIVMDAALVKDGDSERWLKALAAAAPEDVIRLVTLEASAGLIGASTFVEAAGHGRVRLEVRATAGAR